MNGTYFPNPSFPSDETNDGSINDNSIMPKAKNENDGLLDIEDSYIENVLRQNKGKHVKAYISYPDSTIWRDKMYEGYIREASKDHLIVECLDGKWNLIPMIYLDYVEFEDRITYLFKNN